MLANEFTTYLLRPITYIQGHIDPDWTPLIATPNFPTYTSGHSTQSGAAMFVLTHQLGAIPYVDTIHVDRGNTAVLDQLVVDTRSFESFLEAGAEAAVSRLYGGIHYLSDNFDGLQQGQCRSELGVEPVRPCALRTQCLKHPDRSEVRQVHFFSRPGTASARDLYPKDETQNRLGRALHIRKAAWDGEPVFANITRMLALNRFPLRSKRKVNTQ